MSIIKGKCPNCKRAIDVDDTKEAEICEYCGSAFIVKKAIGNLSNAKCPHCGSVLEVDAYTDAAICSICGTPFIVEKAIGLFNCSIHNSNILQTMSTNISSMENIKERALTLEKLEDSFQAKKLWIEAIQKFPQDYQAWLGILPYSFTGTSGTGYNFLKVFRNILQLYGEMDDNLREQTAERIFYKAAHSFENVMPEEWEIFLKVMPQVIYDGQKKARELVLSKLNAEELLVLSNIMDRTDYSSTATTESFIVSAKRGTLHFPLERIDGINYSLMLPCIIGEHYYYFYNYFPSIHTVSVENLTSSIRRMKKAYETVKERTQKGLCASCGKPLNIWGRCKNCHL